MTVPADRAGRQAWDLEVRPRLMPRFAYGAAFVIAAAHIAVSFLLDVKASGVFFRTTDQVAIIGIGLILAAGVLLFTRPRLRVGAAGLSVRNLFADRLIPWPQVVGVSFPASKRWAQVDLPDDEYIAVMAIQAVDKDRAVRAIEAVRGLVARYRPPSSPEPPPTREQT